MAICKLCGGHIFDAIHNIWDRHISVDHGLIGDHVTVDERQVGTLYQCRECKRVFRYYGYGIIGDGKLPSDDTKV